MNNATKQIKKPKPVKWSLKRLSEASFWITGKGSKIEIHDIRPLSIGLIGKAIINLFCRPLVRLGVYRFDYEFILSNGMRVIGPSDVDANALGQAIAACEEASHWSMYEDEDGTTFVRDK